MKNKNINISNFLGSIIVVICIFVLLPLSALAEQTLTVWAMGAEGKLIQEVAKKFESENPGVKVIAESIPWTGAHEKFVTSVMSGMTPDVAQMGTTWMSEFHAMNALENLTPYFAQTESFDKDEFFPTSTDSVVFNSDWYGVPWYVDTRVFYYRSDLVQQAGFNEFPKTWEEFSLLSQKIYELHKNNQQKGYAITLPVNDWQIFLMFYWQAGGELFPQGQEGPFIDPEKTAQTLEYMKTFFDSGVAPKEVGRDMDLLSSFESGYYPMFISGPWSISDIEKNKPQLKGQWMTAPMTKSLRNSSYMGGCNLVIFKQSAQKELAWKFVAYMSRPEIQSWWYEISKDLPSNQLAWEDESLKTNPYLLAFQEQLKETRSTPNIPEWERIANTISTVMELTIHEKVAPQQAGAVIEEEVQTILKAKGQKETTPLKMALTLIAILIPIILLALFFYRSHEKKPERIQYASYLFLFPGFMILLTFLFLPIIGSFVASLTNWNLYSVTSFSNILFVGLDNYVQILQDGIFWKGLLNTLLFAFIGVPLNIIISLGVAIALNNSLIKMTKLYRLGFFIPSITTMVAVAIIFRWFYNPEFGLLNLGLEKIGISGQNWLANEWLALPSLIFMAVWKGFGYNMLIFLAALQAIPESLYESIEIDGANEWQKLIYVTLPMMKKMTFFITIVTSIGYLQFFAEPYIMTGGGPLNATMSVVLYMYQHGFKFYNLGYASAIAYILCILMILLTLIQRRFQKYMEDTI